MAQSPNPESEFLYQIPSKGVDSKNITEDGDPSNQISSVITNLLDHRFGSNGNRISPHYYEIIFRKSTGSAEVLGDDHDSKELGQHVNSNGGFKSPFDVAVHE